MIPSFNFKKAAMLSSLVLFGCASAPPVPVTRPTIYDFPPGVYAAIEKAPVL